MDELTRRQQFYQFSRGRPRAHVFQTVNSTDAPAHERYEYWLKSVIYNLEVPRPNEVQQRDFVASVTSLATVSGEMHYAEADSYEAIRTDAHVRAGGEELSLIYMLEGSLLGEYACDVEITAEAGQFYFFDAARSSRIRLPGHHRLIQIDLSRGLLSTVFAGNIPAPSIICEALNRSKLCPLLGAHLAAFPSLALDLDPVEQLGFLDATEAFAVTTIENAFAAQYGDHGGRSAGLFAAAQRYIRINLGKAELSPDEIALAIGCSRATLYRIFAERNVTVRGQIREVRLQKLKSYLESADQSVPISVLAQRSGLFDIPNVNRAFRQRFGLSPSELREGQKSSADRDAR